MSPDSQLRRDAESIWRAGVAAVDSERLTTAAIQLTNTELVICGHEIPLSTLNRLVVVGAGKAGAGMAAGFEQAIGEQLVQDRLTGWINVPADCVRPLKSIHLHAARPAGVNEPTAEGVHGAQQILSLISPLDKNDVCVVLLSGGGSALLPAPVPEITLADKQQVTRMLMHAGATIDELNCVRKQLSQLKGGGLARATGAGLILTLIISDVIGDPLDVIASGPTVGDSKTAADALAILTEYATDKNTIPDAVLDYLQRKVRDQPAETPLPASVHNHVIGNNETALSAAARKAAELGYAVHSFGSENRGQARDVGRQLAESALTVRDTGQPVPAPACLLSGGEPVVQLAPSDTPRKGGRNQEVAAAVLARWWDADCSQMLILAGGTDGEDGPTDAAGGIADAEVLSAARAAGLHPDTFLANNNTYPLLEQTGGLLKTGPTHTNVMDLRVALIVD